MTPKPTESPIDEIHRIRREISDRFGGDIAAIAEDAARRQAASERPTWRPKANSAFHAIGSSSPDRDKDSNSAAG